MKLKKINRIHFRYLAYHGAYRNQNFLSDRQPSGGIRRIIEEYVRERYEL